MNANKQDAGGLPEPYATIAGHGDVYTADQMRAYGELCRAAPAGSGEVEPPKWYTREEIVSALRLMNYSDLIAQELADWFVRHLQHAFNKGHRIGQRDAASSASSSSPKTMAGRPTCSTAA